MSKPKKSKDVALMVLPPSGLVMECTDGLGFPMHIQFYSTNAGEVARFFRKVAEDAERLVNK